jgi:hypothetical protein
MYRNSLAGLVLLALLLAPGSSWGADYLRRVQSQLGN